MSQLYRRNRKTWKWLPITFGCYRGKTLPEILFLNPGYIFWLIAYDVIKQENLYMKELARQAEVIVDCACRILPQLAPRDRYEFLILVDHDGIFARAITVAKGSPVPKKFRAEFILKKRCKVLDANSYSKYARPDIGWKRMASSLRRTLFPYIGKKPDAADYQGFLINSSNFAPK